MKVLSFHPFSLFTNGGGSRILRRIYEGHEAEVDSLAVESAVGKHPGGEIPETVVPVLPQLKPWMRWYVRDYVRRLQQGTFKPKTIRRIQNEASRISYDVLHIVNHGSFSTAFCEEPRYLKQPLWVSFHDHFDATEGSYKDAEQLWHYAARRLVISENLGTEYSRLFGSKKYEIITDGVLPDEISTPTQGGNSPLTIYFAGLLHIDYLPLFRTLADALEQLTNHGLKVKLILRGTQHISFLQSRLFEVEYRPFSTNDKELKEELDAATILYLPIKFNQAAFYLYSLSTKMVGYLGASGTIMYHGPADSAACELLKKTKSAICCNTLNSTDLLEAIKSVCRGENRYSHNAKLLALERFELGMIRKRFWNPQ